MECIKIKEVIPLYIEHKALDKDVQIIEEHLCVCNDCRQFLGQCMDKVPVSITDKKDVAINNDSRQPDISQIKVVTGDKKIGIFEYIILGIGVSVLGFFLFLLLTR